MEQGPEQVLVPVTVAGWTSLGLEGGCFCYQWIGLCLIQLSLKLRLGGHPCIITPPETVFCLLSGEPGLPAPSAPGVSDCRPPRVVAGGHNL